MAFRQADYKLVLVERKLISPGFHQLHVGQQMVRFLSYDHFCSLNEFFGTHVAIDKRMSGLLRCFQIDMKQLRFLLVLWAVFWQKPSKVLLLCIYKQVELLACHLTWEEGEKWSGSQLERFLCGIKKKLVGFHKNVIWGMHRLFPSPEKCGISSVLCTITTEGTLFMLQKHYLYWQQSPGISNFLKVWTMWEFSVIEQ